MESEFDIGKVTGVGEYMIKEEKVDDKPRMLYLKGERAFLVVNQKTVELRTDAELGRLLTEKYESVMWSRYFGKGGIEVVLAGGQLDTDEMYDLVRLSYNLT